MEYVEIEDLIDTKDNSLAKEKLITKPELFKPDSYQDVRDPREYIEHNLEQE